MVPDELPFLCNTLQQSGLCHVFLPLLRLYNNKGCVYIFCRKPAMLRKIEEEVTERSKALSKPDASSSGAPSSSHVCLVMFSPVTVYLVCVFSVHAVSLAWPINLQCDHTACALVLVVMVTCNCIFLCLSLQVSVGLKKMKPPKPDDNFIKTFLSGSKCLSGVSHANTSLTSLQN